MVGADLVDAFFAERYDADSLTSLVETDRAIFPVATIEGTVVGFALARPDDADADGRYGLPRLYVDPDRWSEGIGRRLLSAVEGRVRDRGADRLRLVAMVGNDRAIEFYETAGYERVASRRDDVLDVRGYVYEKDLDADGA